MRERQSATTGFESKLGNVLTRDPATYRNRIFASSREDGKRAIATDAST
jgi:hypothetical protein